MELKLSCPCRHEMSKRLITSIFVGPPVLLFAIVSILLNPFRYVCKQCSAKEGSCAYLTACFKNAFGICCQCCGDKTNVDRLIFWKDLGRCLILPIIWVIILLLDGDYLACYWTNWEGKHVFDKEIKKMWCQPTELVNARNESEIQHEYQMFISESQFRGYLLLGAFGLVIILFGALSNCWNKEGVAPGTRQEDKPFLDQTAL